MLASGSLGEMLNLLWFDFSNIEDRGGRYTVEFKLEAVRLLGAGQRIALILGLAYLEPS